MMRNVGTRAEIRALPGTFRGDAADTRCQIFPPRRRSVRRAVLALLICGVPATLAAHDEATLDPSKTMTAQRVEAGSSPRVDGVLDDEVWLLAPSYTGLTQAAPDDGEPATEKTTIQFAYDDEALFVAMTLYYSGTIDDQLTRRDQTQGVDRFRIEIDAHHDHQTAYMFEISAAGSLRDGHVTDDGAGFDGNWDGVWEGRVSRHDEGLSAEWRIPYHVLRFSPAADYTWGINVVRKINSTKEDAYWVRVPRHEKGWVSRFGHLEGIEGISPANTLEVLPYTVGRATFYPGSASDDTDLFGNLGAHVRYGLTSSTSLNATVNPDFGQVEADPAVLNLSVFETFYSERRPFFVEGAQMFRTPIQLFYSRRIGRQPGHLPTPAGYAVVDRPDFTTVLGAAKVTGKTRGKTTFGLMEAVTAAEHARVETTLVEPGGDERRVLSDALVEPRSNYLVGRVMQDVLGNSRVGLIATALNRADPSTSAYSAGLDWLLKRVDNSYDFEGQVAVSRAGAAGDRSSGVGAQIEAGKRTGHLLVEVGLESFSDEFQINDMGFQSRNDYWRPQIDIELRNKEPWGHFRENAIEFSRWGRWNFDDVALENGLGIDTWHQLANYWWFGGNYTHRFRTSDDLDTRGGPLIENPASDNYEVWLSNDWRQSVNGDLWFGWRSDDGGSTDRWLGGNLTVKPASNLEFQLRPRYSWNFDDAQWVTNVDDDDSGTGVVYGEMDSKTLDLTARADIIFSPTLSLELYMQPFLTVGDFDNFKELALADSYEFTPFADPGLNPDFRRRSLRSNVVLRWEYRLGSTLFLVWSQSRSDSSASPRLRPVSNIGSSFTDSGTNVFLVKLNYWSNL